MGEIDALGGRIENPFATRFVTELFVAENARGHVRAAAVLLCTIPIFGSPIST